MPIIYLLMKPQEESNVKEHFRIFSYIDKRKYSEWQKDSRCGKEFERSPPEGGHNTETSCRIFMCL